MNFAQLKKILDSLDLTSDSEVHTVRNADADGTALLREGKIQVADPGHLGEPATIKPGGNVVLFVNGLLVKEEIAVSSQDEIELYPESTPGERYVNLSIADSQLSARLKVTYAPGVIYTLLDSGPEHHLIINAVPGRYEDSEPYTANELLEYLRDNGVVYGVDCDTVAKLAQEGGDAIIARGLPPSLGNDAKIDILFRTEVFIQKVKSETSIKVDILDQFDIAQVKPGDVLARKSPPSPGQPGITIAGIPLDPPEPEDLALLVGTGAELSPDGLAVVATESGLPRLKNNIISVLPFYNHPTSLDAKHGHLSFDGHVLVSGDVTGGVRLSASGDILVQGSVSDGEIVAGGNLTVKGAVISSKIKAGGQDAILSSVITKLITLGGEIGLLANAVSQVLTNPSFANSGLDDSVVGHLVSLLVEKKFASIAKDFEELHSLSQEAGRENLGLLLVSCAQKFTPFNLLKFKNVQEIRAIEGLLVSKARALSSEINSPANLHLTYAQNSILEASGKILCIGKGCYDCELYAGDEVSVIGRDGGYFRGRKIVSGGNVDIADLGNPSGQETTVELTQNFKLRADIVRNNTVIKAGRQSTRITEDKRLLKSWVDYKGQLTVSALKLQPEKASKRA